MAAHQAIDVTLHVVRELDRLGISYLVVGSLASSLHGIPRSTQDADLVVDLPASKVAQLVSALGDDFYVEIDHARDAVERKTSFNVIHLDTMFKVDLFVLGDAPLDQLEMDRRQRFQLSDEVPLEVASAEDTVLQKLRWYQLGRGVSDRQWQDAVGVLRVQAGKLDRTYLEEHARALGVDKLLRRALT